MDDPDFDDDGRPAWAVLLDQTLRQPGDVLTCVYDYGDFWELTIELESVQPATEDSPVAVLIDGERAGPPEDCGGLTDGQRLADALDDPLGSNPTLSARLCAARSSSCGARAPTAD